MCYWYVEMEKRGNNYKNIIVFVASGDGQNCHRLWWAFNCQFKSSSVPMVADGVADIPGYRF